MEHANESDGLEAFLEEALGLRNNTTTHSPEVKSEAIESEQTEVQEQVQVEDEGGMDENLVPEFSLFDTNLQVVRAQISTSRVKQCTYFAHLDGWALPLWDRNRFFRAGERVFIKGPFRMKEQASVCVLVNTLRELWIPTLALPFTQVVKLRTSVFEKTQAGQRLQMLGKPAYFQITKCIIQGLNELPVKDRKSRVLWREPVEVVNWQAIAKGGRFAQFVSHPNYEDHLFFKHPTMGVQLVKLVLLSWVTGTGGDLAFRNFILDFGMQEVYQVDIDTIRNPSWKLEDAQICSRRSKAGQHFRRFLYEHWHSRAFDDIRELSQTIARNKQQCFAALAHIPVYLVTQDPEPIYRFFLERAREVSTLPSILRLLGWEDSQVPPTPPPASVSASAPASTRPLKRSNAILASFPSFASSSSSSSNYETDASPDDGCFETDREAKRPRKAEQEENGENSTANVFAGLKSAESLIDQREIYRGKSSFLYNQEQDAFGVRIDVRKSDFQKAVRRSNPKQALASFFACFNLASLFPREKRAKGVRTNIINRLLVCAMEDVGVANVPLVNRIALEVFRISIRKRQVADPRLLASLVIALCESKKTRVMSHMAHTYHPQNLHIAKEHGLDTAIKPEETLGDFADARWFGMAATNPDACWEKLEKTRAVPKLLWAIYNKIADRNKACVIRYALACAHFRALGALEETTDAVLPGTYSSDVEQSLQFQPKAWGLKTVTGYPPLPRINTNNFREYTNREGTVVEILPPLCLLLKNHINVKPANEALDMHTAEGRKLRAREDLKVHFRRVGAHVENEDKRFFSPSFKNIYELSTC